MLHYLACLMEVSCSSWNNENCLISARTVELSHAVEALPMCACAPSAYKKAGVS